MSNKTNKARPALPTGMVVVDKGGGDQREVVVGVLSGTRMPAHGFDVHGYAPNHYRVVNHGPFGVILGTRVPIEVRVILDGNLVTETRFYPTEIPLQPGMDPTLTEARSEMPQPFMILNGQDGKPLMFAPFSKDLTADEIVAAQLHAEAMATPPALTTIDHGVPVTTELKVDLTAEELARFMPPAPPAKPDHAPTVADGATSDGDTLAEAVQGPPQGKDNLPADVPAFGDVYRDGDTTAEAPAGSIADHPLIDTTERSKTWAPSHGLVAIGVRIIQESPENEHPTPPDAFTYVLFQLNPWEIHVKAMAALQGRVILPSKDSLKKVMEAEGFSHELGPQHEVHCGGISCDHRRKRR